MNEPHWGFTRLGQAVHRSTLDHLPVHNAYARFNKTVAVKIDSVGSMTCAWVFSLIALISLPLSLRRRFTCTCSRRGWCPQG